MTLRHIYSDLLVLKHQYVVALYPVLALLTDPVSLGSHERILSYHNTPASRWFLLLLFPCLDGVDATVAGPRLGQLANERGDVTAAFAGVAAPGAAADEKPLVPQLAVSPESALEKKKSFFVTTFL